MVADIWDSTFSGAKDLGTTRHSDFIASMSRYASSFDGTV